MLSAPGLSDDEYMRFFDECIAIPVDDPHPCDSTIREDVKVKSEDSLNPPMQLASVRVENLQASVTLSVSALYSTPCASDKQGNKAFLAAAKSLSVVPYSSSYICKAEPAEGHKSLTVPDASDSQSQLVNKRRLTILGPRPTAPVTSGIRRMTSSTVLGKRRKGQEDLAQDSGGKDETEEHIASKRRSKSLTVPDACDSQSQLVNMHRWIILGPPRPPAASLAVTSGTRRMTSSTVLGKRKKGQEDLPQDSGGKDETRENVGSTRSRKRAKGTHTEPQGRSVCSNKCGKTFSRKHDERRHTKTACPFNEDKLNAFLCPICGESNPLSRGDSLQRHLRDVHKCISTPSQI